MFSRFVALISLAALTSTAATNAVEFPELAWTYQTTDSTCLGNATSPCGQEYWGKVSATCAPTFTSTQSPINFDATSVVMDNTMPTPVPFAKNGGCKSWVQFASRSVFEVSFQDAHCENLGVMLGGVTYTLAQIHFHSPSEHSFGGGLYPAEAHLVHKSAAGKLVVIGIPLTTVGGLSSGPSNAFLSPFWSTGYPLTHFSGESHNFTVPTAMSPYSSFVPGKPGMYAYDGSLTTPACTEGVKWFVYAEPVPISTTDLANLVTVVSSTSGNILSAQMTNNRSPQPLNGRVVRYTTGQSVPTPSPTLSGDEATGATALSGIALVTAVFTALFLFFVIYRIYNPYVPAPASYNAVEMTKV